MDFENNVVILHTEIINDKKMDLFLHFRRMALLTVLLCTSLLGAAREYHFRHIKIEDGLSSNTVYDIVQDRTGFIWAITSFGLDRYDGLSVKTMLRNVAVGHLMIDSKGRLWITTESDLSVYDALHERFVPVTVAKGSPSLPKGNITGMVEDRSGRLWLSTYAKGIYCYNMQTRTVIHYGHRQGIDGSRAILCDSENNIWVTARFGTTPLMRLNKARNMFEPFVLSGLSMKKWVLGLSLFEDGAHQLWVGTWDAGLISVNRFTGQAKEYTLQGGKGGAHHIHTIREVEPGVLMVGSDDGLARLDVRTGENFVFPTNGSPLSLSNKSVYSIYKDREGGLWVGTYYGGLNYLSPSDGQFESYTHIDGVNSVSGNTIASFCEDGQGMIWITSDDGGLSCFNPHTGLFRCYPSESGPQSLSYHNAHALLADNGRLWVGTYGGGLNILDVKSGRFSVFSAATPAPHRISDFSVYSLYREPDGKVWIGTMRGIDLYNPVDGTFRTMKTTEALTIDIDADQKGNLWFSTSGSGIWCLNAKSGQWRYYCMKSKNLYSNDVNAMFCDHAGEIWVCTSKGLCRFDAAKDKFVAVALAIPNQNIMGIVEDGDNLWLTTEKGLVRYTPSTHEWILFNKNNGLVCDQFTQNSAFMASDGKIYVGTVEGFNAFYPHNIQPNEVVPPVVITALEVDNHPVEVSDKGILTQSISHTERIDLGSKDNVVSFSFASLSYSSPENNRYAYRLEGFDKTWVEVTGTNKATYTNLPPGSYTFRVKATNNDGIWNETGATLKVVVHPPFYWSIWAKLFYLVLIGTSIFYLFRRYRLRTERRHAYRLHLMTQEKEKEVYTAKIEFFTTIAHEIRTPVSLIIGPLEKIMQNKDLPVPFRGDLSVIQRNSQRLLNLVNQLLDFRKVEQGGLKIVFRHNAIVPLVKAVADRFKPWTEQLGHTFEVVLPEKDFEADCDAEAVTKVMSNLMTNANKYTHNIVKLECRLADDGRHFSISVTDDGQGISEEEKQRIFQPFYQAEANKPGTGIGLSIVRHIVDRHNGKIDLQTEVGKGSTFIVTLPVHQVTEDVDEPQHNSEEKVPTDILGEKPVSDVTGTDTVSSEEETVNGKPVMLIVDDNEDMLAFLSSNFVDEYCILTAVNGREALTLLGNHTVSLIISDWMMPVMDGAELCRSVRHNPLFSHIPLVLLTAKTDIGSKIEGMDIGADAYIEKPFSIAYLKSCIHNLLALRSMLRQKFSQMPSVTINTLTENPIDRNFLKRLNGIIEENFSNNELSVEFLADKMCISRSGLFVKVRSLTDFTPNELIQVVRLKKAAELLQEHKFRMNEVCYKVGFNNPSYFAKCFQKQFGVKPSEYTPT
jgi:signal transduction histidine kinase/ligand-binding sensor domain-containing protein/DNA-binding response OmpR family regulator